MQTRGWLEWARVELKYRKRKSKTHLFVLGLGLLCALFRSFDLLTQHDEPLGCISSCSSSSSGRLLREYAD